ncbi:MAG: triose-phosphate isomerase [Candidatus Hermodarchaeota archaeon]
MLEYPVIIINYKAYPTAIGKKAIELSKIANKVAQEFGVTICVAPQHVDVPRVAEVVNIPVLAQSIDPIKPGSGTGHVLAEAVKEAGAIGTLINHSEHRLLLADIEECITRAKEAGLSTIVCSNNISTSAAIATMHPESCAFEPPDLIGGDVSVTTRPKIVMQVVEAINRVNPNVIPLTGAGVKTGEDVFTALKLKTQGVLLASGVTKSKNPKETMSIFAEAIVKFLGK